MVDGRRIGRIGMGVLEQNVVVMVEERVGLKVEAWR